MNIKSLLSIVALSLFFVSCKNDKDKFVIVGEIANMPEQTVLLEEMGMNGETKVLDSSKTNSKGHFELSSSAAERGLYQIHFAENKFILLSIQKENIKIIGEWKNLVEQYSVSGSPASTSLKTFFANVRQYINDIQTLNMVTETMRMRGNDSLLEKSRQQTSDINLQLTQYIEHYSDTTKFVRNAIYAVKILNSESEKPFLDAFAASLPTRFPNEQSAKDYIAMYNKGEGGASEVEKGPIEGSIAPEITLNTPDGQVVKLSSFKGKYVLVDFWASWCTPCRRENPNVVAAYKMFKEKNFTILGVSLDNDQGKWKSAIEQDHLEWTQISDLKGWESIAARDYNISSIPSNFLIDPNGKIIGVDLRGPELEDLLSKLLK